MADEQQSSWLSEMGSALGICSNEPEKTAEQAPVFDGAAGVSEQQLTDGGANEASGSWWDKATGAVKDAISGDDENETPNQPAAGESEEDSTWWDKAKQAASDAYDWATGDDEEAEAGSDPEAAEGRERGGGEEESEEENAEPEKREQDSDPEQVVIGSETGPYSLTVNVVCAGDEQVMVNLARGEPAEPRVGRSQTIQGAGEGNQLSPILFQNLPAGTYGVTVTQSDVTATGAVTFPGAIAELHLNLREEKPLLEISVDWAEDPDRDASVGIKVENTSGGGLGATLSTNYNGYGAVRLKPGNYRVIAICGAARAAAAVTVTKGQDNYVELTLSQGATLNVVVRWADTNEPVVGAEVYLQGPSERVSATTIGEGVASFSGLEPGTWSTWTVIAEGKPYDAPGSVELDAGELNTMYLTVRGTRSGKPESTQTCYSPGSLPEYQAAPDGEMLPTMKSKLAPDILRGCRQVCVTTIAGSVPTYYEVHTIAIIDQSLMAELGLGGTDLLAGIPLPLSTLMSLLTARHVATEEHGKSTSASGQEVKYTVIYTATAGEPEDPAEAYKRQQGKQ